ncbi:MAG: DUF2079 domain-containing protein [Ruminococcus sp.]|nr:DUF2079 domain-containing protein [Ruminococcus sp.]
MGNNTKKTSVSFSEKLSRFSLSGERITAAFVASFMLGYIVQMLQNKNFYDLNAYYNSISFVAFWVVTLMGGIALCAATYLSKISSLIPRTLLCVTMLLSVMFASANNSTDVYFLIGIGIVDLIVTLWCVKDDKLELSKIKISYKTCLIAAIALFAFTTVFFSYYTSLRYQNFQNATFDFGIFAQMFENMATTGAPTTTVERSYEMSHFGVHFSPVFYLLLPGYMIFRSPLYLIWAQALCVAAGIFAVYLICKKLGLSGKVTLTFEIIYAFYPCLFNGCFYDFHENKLLTTIILFLFYFIISEKTIITLAMSLLLLSVKEDAAIYLIVIALYVLITRKKYILGSLMLSLAVIYFLIAQKVVASLGEEGVMMWRLSDYFVNSEEGFFSVFKSILFDIGYLIKMMFTADKFPFIIWMFLPLMFTPFAQKQVSTLVLLLPIIPINLMQSWQYQYNIDYQYTYGVAALIIFCAILGIMNLKGNTRRIALVMSLMMCLTLATSTLSPKIRNNTSYEEYYGEQTEAIEELLSTIPKDKSVTAGHFIMPHLYFVKEIYTVPDYYKDIEQTDYFVIDTRNAEHEQSMRDVMGNDYTLVGKEHFVEVYKHN